MFGSFASKSKSNSSAYFPVSTQEADSSLDQQFLVDSIEAAIEDKRLKEIVTNQVLELKSKLSIELVAHKKRLEAKIARELDEYKHGTKRDGARVLV